MADNEITELKTALATALSRIGSMESELRTKPKEAAFDPNAFYSEFVKRFTLDPVGTMRSLNMPVTNIDHVRDALIADKLGAEAPPHMRMLAAQGPQVLASQALNEQLTALSRRVEELSNSALTGSKRQSFKAITESKDKYPNLSKALSVDDSPIMAELEKHGGSAEEFAMQQEAKWAKYGLAPAASTTSADTVDNKGQSTKATPAPLAGQLNTVQQPVTPENKPGVWNADRHAALRDSIVAKVSAPKE